MSTSLSYQRSILTVFRRSRRLCAIKRRIVTVEVKPPVSETVGPYNSQCEEEHLHTLRGQTVDYAIKNRQKACSFNDLAVPTTHGDMDQRQRFLIMKEPCLAQLVSDYDSETTASVAKRNTQAFWTIHRTRRSEVLPMMTCHDAGMGKLTENARGAEG